MSRRYPPLPPGIRQASTPITVTASAATRGRVPLVYARASISAPPTATGGSGSRMPRSPRARPSSHRATPTTAAM